MIDERITAIDASIYRVAAKAIIVRGGTLLLTLEIPKQRIYGLPGGGVDHGENAISTLQRELSEELNLIISKDQISHNLAGVRFSIFTHDRHERLSGMPYLNLYYCVHLRDDQVPTPGDKDFIWADSRALGDLSIVNTQVDDIPMFRSYMEAE